MKHLLILLTILSSSFVSFAQNATIIKSPNELPVNDNRTKIFLGGSIDMGKSENWQARIEQQMSDQNVIILNPRREDWNKDWKPISTDPNFRAQVEWELSALEASNIIIMYFAPNSKSPISLLELGLFAKSDKLMVVCPQGFWRKGNVDIVCEKYQVRNYESLDILVEELKNQIKKKKNGS